MNEKTYTVIRGTSYDVRTPKDVISILDESLHSRRGLKLILDVGDTKTGQSWGEVNDIQGYIGRSTGIIKVPLLIENARSSGGPAILDYCIVKITDAKSKRVLYQHPTYQPSKD